MFDLRHGGLAEIDHRLAGQVFGRELLFLDGVYVGDPDGAVRFRWVKAPTSAELAQLAHTLAHRVGRYLERQGLLERDFMRAVVAGLADLEAGREVSLDEVRARLGL